METEADNQVLRSEGDALSRIASGHPDVVNALWENFPSPYEIDMGDEEAVKRLLAAIVAAAE